MLTISTCATVCKVRSLAKRSAGSLCKKAFSFLHLKVSVLRSNVVLYNSLCLYSRASNISLWGCAILQQSTQVLDPFPQRQIRITWVKEKSMQKTKDRVTKCYEIKTANVCKRETTQAVSSRNARGCRTSLLGRFRKFLTNSLRKKRAMSCYFMLFHVISRCQASSPTLFLPLLVVVGLLALVPVLVLVAVVVGML